MIKRTRMRSLRLSFISACTVIVLVSGMLVVLSAAGLADEAKPDPAGTATGDKMTAVDGAGNSFVVTEPTDKTP